MAAREEKKKTDAAAPATAGPAAAGPAAAGGDIAPAPNGAAGPTASQQAYGGGAAAYATGNDIAFAPGAGGGDQLAAHEAAHDVQQGGPAADDKKAKQ